MLGSRGGQTGDQLDGFSDEFALRPRYFPGNFRPRIGHKTAIDAPDERNATTHDHCPLSAR